MGENREEQLGKTTIMRRAPLWRGHPASSNLRERELVITKDASK